MIVIDIVFFYILSVVSADSNNRSKIKTSRVAVIGGGIGGTVTAYELSKLTANKDYDITLDLYEAAKIGGRLATVEINGHEFETGGSIIHVENKHMQHYVESNGLRWYKEPPTNNEEDNFGLFNGNEFIFVSSGTKMWDIGRLVWRYGLDLMNFESALVKPMLSLFNRIYEAQKNQIHFVNVHSLLAYMSGDFPGFMTVELKDYLKSHGYGDRFIDEFVFLATNINYNQNTNIPVFVGSVSLAGSQSGSLRSVEGGNKRVPETLLARSDARLIKARVESVTLLPDSSFALAVNGTSHVYDYVVIACPIIENSGNNIQLEGFPGLKIPRIKYQKTVATFVHGELNHTFFNYDSPKGFPNEIFSVNNTLFYNSISVLSPVTFDPQYDKKVYKVFSKDVLTPRQLDLLFRIRDKVVVISWLAYPLYDIKDRDLPFELYDNLFYVNAIEWAASAMEMSAISGVNVALKIYKRLEE